MGASVLLGVASLAVGVAGTVASKKAQDDAADEAKKARRVEQAMAARQNAKLKREQVRKARIQRAQVIQQGASSSVIGSSGVQGGAASIDSQAASNIADINYSTALSKKRNVFLNNQTDAISNANNIQAFTKMGTAVLGVAGNYADKNIKETVPDSIFITDNRRRNATQSQSSGV